MSELDIIKKYFLEYINKESDSSKIAMLLSLFNDIKTAIKAENNRKDVNKPWYS